mmetsp:Transcript_27226/g.51058  ORF Transcript_27226/g.51058 Transcript_27226/m.51058 type:complete len:102 (-) Transcript_27226:185-490(-)
MDANIYSTGGAKMEHDTFHFSRGASPETCPGACLCQCPTCSGESNQGNGKKEALAACIPSLAVALTPGLVYLECMQLICGIRATEIHQKPVDRNARANRSI